MTVFDDELFISTDLYTVDMKNHITATLKDPISGRFIPDLLRNDGTGFLVGRMIEPVNIPHWMAPGTIFLMVSEQQEFTATLTYQPIAQSRIKGITDLLGAKVRFSYVVTSEFKKKNV